jgi:pyruvate kinase
LRKTKIICTIGPASANEQTLTRMCMEGMNVARMNFSHGDHAEQLGKINLVKKVRQQLNLPIAIMLDTKGPEYRLGCFENKKVSVNTGDTFTFTTRDVLGNQEMVSVSYKKLHKELRIGDTITACNGMVSFRVDKLQDQDIICTVTEGGELADKKSMSFPNKVMHHQYLSKQTQCTAD